MGSETPVSAEFQTNGTVSKVITVELFQWGRESHPNGSNHPISSGIGRWLSIR